jgi:mycoredoxin-dependent peroxiredoxin
VPVADGATSRATPLEVGDVAADFVLPDGDRFEVRHSEYVAGRAAVVVFFPWAFSSVCTAELCGVRDRSSQLSNHAAATVAISCDATATLRELTRQQNLTYPVLSDHWPHGQVASAFGVFDPALGAAMRATYILDADRVVRWRVLNAVPDARDVDDYVAVLDTL